MTNNKLFLSFLLLSIFLFFHLLIFPNIGYAQSSGCIIEFSPQPMYQNSGPITVTVSNFTNVSLNQELTFEFHAPVNSNINLFFLVPGQDLTAQVTYRTNLRLNNDPNYTESFKMGQILPTGWTHGNYIAVIKDSNGAQVCSNSINIIQTPIVASCKVDVSRDNQQNIAVVYTGLPRFETSDKIPFNLGNAPILGRLGDAGGYTVHITTRDKNRELTAPQDIHPQDYSGNPITVPVGRLANGDYAVVTNIRCGSNNGLCGGQETFACSDTLFSVDDQGVHTSKPINGGVSLTHANGGGLECGKDTILTAIGCIPTNPQQLVNGTIKFSLLVAGGLSLLLMLFGVFGMITSAGNPESLKEANGRFNNALIGLLAIIFAVLFLQIIGVDILNLPGFSK